MPMFPSASLRLGRVGPIEVTINVTWLVIFALLVYWLRTGFIVENAPNLSETAAWVTSAMGALALFASVLAHELAHSLVALRNGLPIRKITLFIFGGVAHMESEPKRPGVELKMAIAGPLLSIGIAVVLGVVRFVLLKGYPTNPAALVMEYTAYANALLACFNLVPGYPLDGGRVLRAILWKATGSYIRATTIAAALGRGVGLGLVFFGGMLSVAWDSMGFLWLVLVGSFLERLAFFSTYRLRLHRDGLRAIDVMRRDFTVVSPSATLEEARTHFEDGSPAHLVVDGGRAVGVLSRAHMASAPEAGWATTRVASVMGSCGQGLYAEVGESARVVLRRMLELGIGCMPVLSGDKVVGMVMRGDLVGVLTKQSAGEDQK